LGKDRNQTEVFCLEQVVSANNIVRLIDLFVESLPIVFFLFITCFNVN